MQSNSLTTCIDRNGQYYRIPICCINDPVNYQQDFLLDALKGKQAPPKELITVS